MLQRNVHSWDVGCGSVKESKRDRPVTRTRAARFRGSFRSLSPSTRPLYGHRYCICLPIGASFSDESFISPNYRETSRRASRTKDLACRDREDWYCLPVSFIIQSAAGSRDGSSKSRKNFLALARKAKVPDGNRRREREREKVMGEGRGETEQGRDVHRNISEHHGIARFIVDCRLSFRLTIHSISLGTILYT